MLTYFHDEASDCVTLLLPAVVITPLRKYDLHRESSGIPDVLAVEETLDHIGLPLATAQV